MHVSLFPFRIEHRLAKHQYFIKLHAGVTESAACKDLFCVARGLLLEIWARRNGMNSGHIHYSHREARLALKVGSQKVTKAFRQCEGHGFLITITKLSFSFKAGSC
jgi:hypothetical protein